MHSRHESSSFWKTILKSIPIAGRFVDSESTIQAASDAACDAMGLTGQVVSMYIFPWNLTAYFPTVSSNMKTQMCLEMFTEMVARMGIGDAIAKVTFRSAEVTAHCLVGNKDHASSQEIAKVLPIIGPFFGADTVKQACVQGMKGNLYQLVMLSSGGMAMMYSPGGMELDPTSVAITTSIMFLSMTASHILLAASEEAIKRSASYLSQFSMLRAKPSIGLEKPCVEAEPLLTTAPSMA